MNSGRRAYCNEVGKSKAGLDSVFVDPEEFVKQQFGSHKFVDIIDKISITKEFKKAMPQLSNPATRNKRVTKLVDILVAPLGLYVDAFPVLGQDTLIGTSKEQLAS
ncbi:hypothetical protein BJ742DRAFT_894560 [Cladochytrium replicatum]|nr:hypothetical protein BJ742DRAFT_894560 [Cladochytrium replicatum]